MTRRSEQISVSSPLGPPPSAPWLGLTGALMLLAAFALFNGWCGFAAKRWPWELLADGTVALYVQAVLVAWLAASLWTVALAFTPTRRVRAVGCAIFGGVLLTAALRDGHPLLAKMDGTFLFVLLTAAAFGAGLLLARDPTTRGRGRLLAGIGGLLYVWLRSLPSAAGEAGPLCTIWEELIGVFGDGGPSTAHVLEHTLPAVLLAIAALGALLTAAGLTGRRLLLVWFFVLLGAWLLRAGMNVAHASFEGLDGFASTLTTTLITHGVLLWLFLLFTIRDLGRWTRS